MLLICLLSHVIGFCLSGATESLPRQLTLARKRNNYNTVRLEVKHSKGIRKHFVMLYDHLECMQPQRCRKKKVKTKKIFIHCLLFMLPFFFSLSLFTNCEDFNIYFALTLLVFTFTQLEKKSILICFRCDFCSTAESKIMNGNWLLFGKVERGTCHKRSYYLWPCHTQRWHIGDRHLQTCEKPCLFMCSAAVGDSTNPDRIKGSQVIGSFQRAANRWSLLCCVPACCMPWHQPE